MRETENEVLCAAIGRIRRDRNDCEASEILFSHFYPAMVGMVARQCPSGGSDFDEMLEILRIALFDAALSYREEKGTLRAYAVSCMRNRLIDYLRTRKNTGGDFLDPLGEEMATLASEEDFERELVGRESYLAILAQVREILSPFQYRVLLYESEGYSTAEIAAKLGTTAKKVENAKYRTRKNQKIRAIFSDR